MKEALSESLIVTVFGISVVFVILFLIICFIKLLSYIINAGKTSSKKDAKKEKEVSAPVQTAEVAKSTSIPAETDEAEVAAIIAAICAMTGLSKQQFVIKSIKRRYTALWKQFKF